MMTEIGGIEQCLPTMLGRWATRNHGGICDRDDPAGSRALFQGPYERLSRTRAQRLLIVKRERIAVIEAATEPSHD
jgi:hypothetical protein